MHRAELLKHVEEPRVLQSVLPRTGAAVCGAGWCYTPSEATFVVLLFHDA